MTEDSKTLKVVPDIFYGSLGEEGKDVREVLWPLASLSPRERAIFVEYHYWKTHMIDISKSHRISLGRSYAVLNKAEEKVASSRSQKEK